MDAVLWLIYVRSHIISTRRITWSEARRSLLALVLVVLVLAVLILHLIGAAEPVERRPMQSWSGFFEYPVGFLCLAYPALYYPEMRACQRMLACDLGYEEKRTANFVDLWNSSMPTRITLEEIKAFYRAGVPRNPFENTKILYQPRIGALDPDPRIRDRLKKFSISQLEIRDRLARMYVCFWNYSVKRGLEDWVLVFGSLYEIERSRDILPPWDDDLDVFISRKNLNVVMRGFAEEYSGYLVNFDPNFRNFLRGRIIDRESGLYLDFFCYDTCGQDRCLYEGAGGHYIFGRAEVYPRRLIPWEYKGERLFLAVPADGHKIHIGTSNDHPCQARGKQVSLWRSVDYPPYTGISAVAYYYFNFLMKTG